MVISRSALARIDLPTDHYVVEGQGMARRKLDDETSSRQRPGMNPRAAEEKLFKAEKKPKPKGPHFAALREQFEEDSKSRMSEHEKALVEDFYQYVSGGKQKNLTRKAFASVFRRWFPGGEGSEGKKKFLVVDRFFSLMDTSQTNTINHVEFLNLISVLLKGALSAQLFFAFQLYRIGQEEHADLLTREELFKHIKLGTDAHPHLAPDFATLLRVFEEKHKNYPTSDSAFDRAYAEGISFDEFRESADTCGLGMMFQRIVYDRLWEKAEKEELYEEEVEEEVRLGAVVLPREKLREIEQLCAESLPKQDAIELAEKLSELCEMFQLFDQDQDGLVSREDLMIAGALTEVTARDVLLSHNLSKTGSLNFEEFVRLQLGGERKRQGGQLPRQDRAEA